MPLKDVWYEQESPPRPSQCGPKEAATGALGRADRDEAAAAAAERTARDAARAAERAARAAREEWRAAVSRDAADGMAKARGVGFGRSPIYRTYGLLVVSFFLLIFDISNILTVCCYG
jgi:hypothetical protein